MRWGRVLKESLGVFGLVLFGLRMIPWRPEERVHRIVTLRRGYSDCKEHELNQASQHLIWNVWDIVFHVASRFLRLIGPPKMKAHVSAGN
jgi:hypothetical protein